VLIVVAGSNSTRLGLRRTRAPRTFAPTARIPSS